MRYILLILAIFISVPDAKAQQCTIDSEVIQSLRKPRYGAPSLSEGTVGDMNEIIDFKDAVYDEEGNITAIGLYQIKDKPDHALILATLDRRGRTQWRAVQKLAGLSDIKRFFPRKNKDGWMILAITQTDQSAPTARLMTMNKDAKILTNAALPKGFTANDILALDDQTYLVAGTMSGKTTPPYGVIMHINAKGGVIYKRAYRPGADTTLLDLTRMENGMIMASGHIGDAQNRQAAWVMMINQKGEIQWQQRYARGNAARVMDTYQVDPTHIMLAGQIVSDDQTIGSAAWVAMIDAQNGLLNWERFYTTDTYHNTAQAILPTNRGRSLSVLMRAKPSYAVNGVSDYLTRVMTLNWRGVLLNLQDYASGSGARANAIIPAPDGNSALVGMVQREYTPLPETREQASDQNAPSAPVMPIDVQNGWVLRIPAADFYQDPCIPKGSEPAPEPSAPIQKQVFP